MKIKKKVFAASLAAAMALNAVCVSSFFGGVSAAGETKYEFEDGKITGVSAEVEEVASASGGKVVHMRDAGETIKVTVNVEKAGMYDLNICYATDGGAKTQKLNVNGNAAGDLALSNHTDFSESNVARIKLNAGENELEFVSYWGWTQFDYLTLTEPNYPELSATSDLADKNATPETQSLMNYLASVYGEHIISGQQEIYKYGPHDFDYEFNYIKDNTGKLPAIRGFDFLNTNPLYGSEDGTVDRMISWVKDSKGIVTASWHITVPKKFSDYNIGDKVDWANGTYKPDETDFDTAKVLEEGTKEREYYMLCLKMLAEQIQKLQDAGVPMIFRPLHEAEGGGGEDGSWFWWGKSGSAVYKDLWKLTYKTLTEDYGLHNIIWEWNSYTFETSTNWYPGDEYVDLVAYDKYNCTDWSTGNAVLVHNDSAIGGTFYSLVEQYGGKKMVAMAENDSIPTLENLQMEKAGWLYFCPWYDGGSNDTNFLTNELFNTKEDLKEMYTSDYCITLDELPDDLYGNGQQGTGTKPSHTTTATTTTTTPEGKGEAAKIVADNGVYNISFKQTIGNRVDLTFDFDGDVNYANGCIGISATVDGVDYWLNYKWEVDSKGEVTAKLDEPFNVTYNNGKSEVTDADMIKKISDEAIKQKNAQVQIWWANDGAGDAMETSSVKLTGAYLPKSGETTTEPTGTTTSDDASQTTDSETETTVSETETTVSATETSATESVTTTVTGDSSETSTETSATTTTTASSGTEAPGIVTTESSATTETEPATVSLYGDANLDGRVDITDAVLMNKAAAGQVELSAQARANADCMADNVLSSDDALSLLQFLVHIISSLPVTPQ